MAAGILAQVGFGSLFMLTWMAAGLIPIFLYLLRKRTRTTVPWAAMRLLRQVVLQESRRSSFQQWLLLITRVAIMLVLATALARPFWGDLDSPTSSLQARPNRLVIFLVDTSYSMGYRREQRSCMDLAKERIEELVHESQLGDAFSLIALDRPSRLIISRPTFDSKALLTELRQMSENARDCDIDSGLTMAADLILDARDDPALPRLVDVVILSDFGADAWSIDPGSPIDRSLNRLQELAVVTAESFADLAPENRAILSVTPSAKRAVVGQPIRFDVKLSAVGGQVSTVPLRLELDGRPVDAVEVQIDPDQTVNVSMQAISRQAGKRLFSVIIPSDNLIIDNRWDLVLDVQAETRVLVVDADSSGFNAWQLALDPPGLPLLDGGFDVIRVVNESEWLSLRLQKWDVIILNNPSLSVPGQLAGLKSFIQAGGLTIVALGSNFEDQASQRTRQQFGQLLGLELAGSSPWGEWDLDPLQYASPIIDMFEGFPGAGLLTTPIFRYWRATVQDAATEVDIGISGGEPLLVRRRVGEGQIACLLTAVEDGRATGENRSWSAIASWPSFLPLAQQLTQTLLSTRSGDFNRLAGQTLSGKLESGEPAFEVLLQKPDQSKLRLLPEPPDASGQSIWSYRHTDQRGVYRVLAPENSQLIFAVNVDAKQSRLESIDVSDLPLRSGSIPGDSIGDPTGNLEARARGFPAPEYAARLLLLLLAGLLVVESLLACFMGRFAR
jgi:hypothetical protein